MTTSTRGTAWSVTINNPTADDEINISVARGLSGWSVQGQLEKGENGTPHYQLFVKTPQVRWAAVCKRFPRGHVELARNVAALANYCQKDDTRIGSLPSSQEKFPSVQKMYHLFETYLEDQDKHNLYLSEEWTSDEWLLHFDAFATAYIKKGYHLEHHAVNPQIRSSIKKFGFSIIFRTTSEKILSNAPVDNTDSQTTTSAEDD